MKIRHGSRNYYCLLSILIRLDRKDELIMEDGRVSGQVTIRHEPSGRMVTITDLGDTCEAMCFEMGDAAHGQAVMVDNHSYASGAIMTFLEDGTRLFKNVY